MRPSDVGEASPAPAEPIRAGLTVVMSAFNEADVIEDCLRSVDGLADETIVVDCSSTDGTGDLARALGARVLVEPNRLMLNTNKNVAIGAARHTWTLLLDPDERVSPALADEIRKVVVEDRSELIAHTMHRLNHELGTTIRSMGHYPDLQLRLFRTGRAAFACEHIHEWVRVDGPVGALHGDLLHFPKPRLYDYVQKRNLYSDHRAVQLFAEGRRFRAHRLLVRPPWYFLRNFVLRGGWRDGMPAFIMAVVGSFGTFLQDAKLWQLERGLVAPGDVNDEPPVHSGELREP